VDEADLLRQQQIYDRPQELTETRKRKASEEDDVSSSTSNMNTATHILSQTNGQAKKAKPEAPRQERKRNNAIYVTSLPDDVTEDELFDVFSRYGVIAENVESNKPRIKLYTDENGQFKGDALIVYFRPESVALAIDMLDEVDFRLGQRLVTGPMRINEADSSYKSQKEQPLSTEQAKTKGTGAHKDRQKVIKKNEQMNRCANNPTFFSR
jgi:HIV Tat-specific factor 1